MILFAYLQQERVQTIGQNGAINEQRKEGKNGTFELKMAYLQENIK